MLVEIDDSTDVLPLLYSAMKHSYSTKAQKDVCRVISILMSVND